MGTRRTETGRERRQEKTMKPKENLTKSYSLRAITSPLEHTVAPDLPKMHQSTPTQKEVTGKTFSR